MHAAPRIAHLYSLTMMGGYIPPLPPNRGSVSVAIFPLYLPTIYSLSGAAGAQARYLLLPYHTCLPCGDLQLRCRR